MDTETFQDRSPEGIEVAMVDPEIVRACTAELGAKVGPRRTQEELRAIEARLGFPLPVGFRTYVAEVDDGGDGVAPWLHEACVRSRALMTS